MAGDARNWVLRALDVTIADLGPGSVRDALSAVACHARNLGGDDGGAIRPFWNDLPWRYFRDGLEIVELLSGGGDDTAASLLRYEAGASVPFHFHTGDEHVLVLEGSQQDEQGRYSKGTTMLNLADSGHSVISPEGCIVGIFWEKPIRFR